MGVGAPRGDKSDLEPLLAIVRHFWLSLKWRMAIVVEPATTRRVLCRPLLLTFSIHSQLAMEILKHTHGALYGKLFLNNEDRNDTLPGELQSSLKTLSILQQNQKKLKGCLERVAHLMTLLMIGERELDARGWVQVCEFILMVQCCSPGFC